MWIPWLLTAQTMRISEEQSISKIDLYIATSVFQVHVIYAAGQVAIRPPAQTSVRSNAISLGVTLDWHTEETVGERD